MFFLFQFCHTINQRDLFLITLNLMLDSLYLTTPSISIALELPKHTFGACLGLPNDVLNSQIKAAGGATTHTQ